MATLFGASLTVINNAPTVDNYAFCVVNYTPREKFYSMGVAHNNHHNIFIVKATDFNYQSDLKPLKLVFQLIKIFYWLL